MRKLFGIILGLLILTVSVNSVNAFSSIEITTVSGITVTQTNPYSTCPDPILPGDVNGIGDVNIWIKNMGANTDTFRLSFENLPSGWDGWIQTDITLASGEKKKADGFVVNIPPAQAPGKYGVTIVSTGSDPTDVEKQTFYVEILNCHVVDVEIVSQEKTICEETNEKAAYDVKITNRGIFDETFDIATSVSWASASKSSVALRAGQSETITLTLDPPAGVTGIQTVSVKAKSITPGSFAQDSHDVALKIDNCYDFNAVLSTAQTNVCLGKSLDYTLTISNTGKNADTYSITAPSWITPKENNFAVQPGQTKTVMVNVVPQQLGNVIFDVQVSSKSDASNVKTVSNAISGEDCRGVAIFILPSDKTACKDSAVEFDVTVKNTGTADDTYTLVSTLGAFGQDKITAKPGETKSVKLVVNTQSLTGKNTVIVKASSGTITDQASADLTVEACYDARVTLSPEKLSTCPFAKNNYTILIENTGKLSDTYSVEFEDFTKSVFLEAGKSETINIPISSDTPGNFSLAAKVTSNHGISIEKTASFSVSSLEQCYSVSLAAEDGIARLEVPRAAVIPIKITNTGKAADKYTVTIAGPSWMYITPRSLSLNVNEYGYVYVYLVPSYGTAVGDYGAKISAKSDFSSSGLDMTVEIASEAKPGEVTPPPEKPPEKPNVTDNVTPPVIGNVTIGNVTLPPNESIELNVSFDNLTFGDNITGGIVAKPPFAITKTMIVAIITIIIIIILIIRFVFLWKK